MRTPNAACVLCEKPLYRRPNERARFRYFACVACRSEAQKVAGITERQQVGLSLGREKGTNHRAGYKHREESKRKASVTHKLYCSANPEKVAARGEKMRGPAHYRWRGGASKLNTAVRQLPENRKWMDAIKARDGACVECGSCVDLEAHHLTPLAELIERHGIKTRDEARGRSALWALANGVTLCRACHYATHGRRAAA